MKTRGHLKPVKKSVLVRKYLSLCYLLLLFFLSFFFPRRQAKMFPFDPGKDLFEGEMNLMN